ncbi:hypothetical protein [[Mycoplasma] testudinis]|uniref:hypothetical protein n=1 Tax=[Mycoplasma] testudinis TaxID=33924 RepID=UPI00047FBF98|nr:hypothetical protein [[Mycoplasma] testudinis]
MSALQALKKFEIPNTEFNSNIKREFYDWLFNRIIIRHLGHIQGGIEELDHHRASVRSGIYAFRKLRNLRTISNLIGEDIFTLPIGEVEEYRHYFLENDDEVPENRFARTVDWRPENEGEPHIPFKDLLLLLNKSYSNELSASLYSLIRFLIYRENQNNINRRNRNR